jgi:hypothetical protein
MSFPRSLSLSLLLLVAPLTAHAQDIKRECVDASTAGQTHRNAAELVEARQQFLSCSQEACPSVVRDSCNRWLAEVEELIPSVVLHASDATDTDITEGSATIDGISYPLDGKTIPLNPGKHVVVFEGPDGARVEKKLLLASGEKSRRIELRLEDKRKPAPESPAPPTPALVAPPTDTPRPAPRAIPTGAWFLGGVSAVGFGSFVFFGLSAKSEHGKLKDACAPSCTSDQMKTGRTNALIADISLGVGVAALAGSITWALLSHPSEPHSAASARLSVAPTPHGGFAAFTTPF